MERMFFEFILCDSGLFVEASHIVLLLPYFSAEGISERSLHELY